MALSVGVLGIGRMGLPICSRLVQHGFRVSAFDSNPDLANAAREAGATWAPAGSELARSVEVLITVLPGRRELGDAMADGSGFVGIADQVADFIEKLGDDADNDGFIFSGDLHPVTIHGYLDQLVPALRKRGVLRSEFGNGGVRANLNDF